MITLDEHEKSKRNIVDPKETGNGLKCPECGEELFDSPKNVQYACNPPKKGIACKIHKSLSSKVHIVGRAWI